MSCVGGGRCAVDVYGEFEVRLHVLMAGSGPPVRYFAAGTASRYESVPVRQGQ